MSYTREDVNQLRLAYKVTLTALAATNTATIACNDLNMDTSRQSKAIHRLVQARDLLSEAEDLLDHETARILRIVSEDEAEAC